VVTVAALMAVAALAAITFNESAERTELIYRSSLDNTQNPAAGSGKGGWSSGDSQVSYGSSQLDDTYYGENSDAPGIPSSYMWATTNAVDPSDKDAGPQVQEGHDNNWIYDNGPVPGPIKGAKSHYYNEWRWDSDPDTSGDFVTGANVPEEDTEAGVDPSWNLAVANERSNPDHTTSEPYTAASSYGSMLGGTGGPEGVSSTANILNFDPWLMDSNGIY